MTKTPLIPTSDYSEEQILHNHLAARHRHLDINRELRCNLSEVRMTAQLQDDDESPLADSAAWQILTQNSLQILFGNAKTNNPI